MLRFLNDEKIIISSIGARTLYLYYPDIIDKADEYTKKCQKRAEDKEQEQPESARELAFECEQMSLYGASRMQDDARTFFEKKGVKH